jgi:Fe-S-cluster containining protein
MSQGMAETGNSGGNIGPLEWFAQPSGPEGGLGLRFSCTMCGNCCSGPSGYVLVNDAECAALAKRLGISTEEFMARYTHMMELGRSLNERSGPYGLDCVFLDREKIPGKAVCGVYEDRPRQCRSWPFWPSLVRNERTWASARNTCPGIDKGTLHSVVQVRIMRDSCEI